MGTMSTCISKNSRWVIFIPADLYIYFLKLNNLKLISIKKQLIILF